LQINFFRPVWNERLKAVARPVHRGRTISRYVCDITRGGWEVSRASYEQHHDPSRRSRPREINRAL
jgi:acyl-coenzyme A thioesterase PaaI-like protein